MPEKIIDPQRRVGGRGGVWWESLGVVKPTSLGQYSRESIPNPSVREFVVWQAMYRVEKNCYETSRNRRPRLLMRCSAAAADYDEMMTT